MSFYAERFQRPDEEDIWEELRQMLINSDTLEAQKKLQEAREIEAFNKAWDRANGVGVETTSQAKPYLTYEELMDEIEDKTSHGQPTDMSVPVQKGYVTNVKPSPYEEIDAKLDWSEELKAQKKAEVKAIQETARARENEINREHILEQAKNYGGAALEVGSLAIPGMLQRKVATQAIKMGKPLAEQIVKKTVKRGAIEGTLSGAIEGLGRGIREDENLLKTTAQGAAIGGVAGTALGKVAGEAVAKTPKIKELDDVLDKRKDWGIAFRKQSGQPKEAIEKLLEQKQGFVPKATSKEGVGDIDFVWGKGGKRGYGLSHVIDRRNSENIDGVEFVKSIPDIIEKGTIKQLPNQPNISPIQSGKDSALIKKVWDDKKRQWVITAFRDKSTPNKFNSRTPDITKNSSEMTPSANLLRDNNIIPSAQQNLNPTTPRTRQNSQIPTFESEEDWLKRLRRQRQRRGLF